jgi:hypothetical protein
MQELLPFLSERFGADQIQTIERNNESFTLITLLNSNELRVLMTNGLSNHRMNVHEKHVGEEFAELFVLLPSYWKLDEPDNPRMNWVFDWLSKLKKHVIEKDTWIGNGHTFSTGKDMASISPTMLQNHFILSVPLELAKELAPIEMADKSVYFLSLIPIFADEMDYKQGKGTAKLFSKFALQNITEKLDDFRSTVLKTRWNFLAK